MKNSFRLIFPVLLGACLSGCATWSTSSVSAPGQADLPRGERQRAPSAAAQATPTASIIVTENDITDRPYDALGDIKVTVNKTTIFSPDPTHAQVDEQLREEASKLGANAVVLVRYGTVGVGIASWGSLDGQGR